MPSVTSRGTRRSQTTKMTNGGTFAPSSIMLSRKNLDSALEKTPPKPKSSARIETWRREVSQCMALNTDPTSSSTSSAKPPLNPNTPIPPPTPILEHKKLSIWKRIIMKFSRAQKAQAQEAREEENYQRTGMWDEGSVRLGPGSDSSLDYGSGSWESELGEIAGFDRFAARRDRLWRAQKLLEETAASAANASAAKETATGASAASEGKGKQKALIEPEKIPEKPPVLNSTVQT